MGENIKIECTIDELTELVNLIKEKTVEADWKGKIMNKHERYETYLSKVEHLMKDCGISYEEEIEFLQYVLDQTIFLHEWAKKV